MAAYEGPWKPLSALNSAACPVLPSIGPHCQLSFKPSPSSPSSTSSSGRASLSMADTLAQKLQSGVSSQVASALNTLTAISCLQPPHSHPHSQLHSQGVAPILPLATAPALLAALVQRIQHWLTLYTPFSRRIVASPAGASPLTPGPRSANADSAVSDHDFDEKTPFTLRWDGNPYGKEASRCEDTERDLAEMHVLHSERRVEAEERGTIATAAALVLRNFSWSGGGARAIAQVMPLSVYDDNSA